MERYHSAWQPMKCPLSEICKRTEPYTAKDSLIAHLKRNHSTSRDDIREKYPGIPLAKQPVAASIKKQSAPLRQEREERTGANRCDRCITKRKVKCVLDPAPRKACLACSLNKEKCSLVVSPLCSPLGTFC